MGNLANLATSTVATAPSPATSGTSLVVAAGEGARFPATPFYAIAHPDGVLPTIATAEIVQVTAVATDTLTIVRAQLGTAAKSVVANWRISNPVLKQDFDDKQAASAELTALAAIAPSNDDIIQRKAGAWTNRTPAQVKTDLALTKTDVSLANVTNDAQIKSADFPSSSVDSEIALFSSTTGKVLKRDSTTGMLKASSGVLAAASAGTDYVSPTGAETITNKTFDSTSPTAFFQPGFVMPHAGRTAPSGWLLCDGSAVSRSTYASLFGVLCESVGTFTVTIATPGVFTLTAHGLQTGSQVYLTTTGALPTGLTANTLYYAVKIDANTFNLATSRANAYAGTNIATSGTQSGTHTLRWCPFGLGDGSTTFNVPDYRGRALVGHDYIGGTAASRLTAADTTNGVYGNFGATGGSQSHILLTAEMPAHSHPRGARHWAGNSSGSGGRISAVNVGGTGVTTDSSSGVTDPTGGDGAHNNVQPSLLTNVVIKT